MDVHILKLYLVQFVLKSCHYLAIQNNGENHINRTSSTHLHISNRRHAIVCKAVSISPRVAPCITKMEVVNWKLDTSKIISTWSKFNAACYNLRKAKYWILNWCHNIKNRLLFILTIYHRKETEFLKIPFLCFGKSNCEYLWPKQYKQSANCEKTWHKMSLSVPDYSIWIAIWSVWGLHN